MKITGEDFISFIKERLAAHEGGAGSICIGWDDATFQYLITQKNLSTKNWDILGCSKSLNRSIELAVTNKKFD